MANFYKKSQIVNGGALQKKAQSGCGRAQQEKAQSGRSMVEMLGVLAIIGVLSVGGIAGYSKAMSKWKINKALDQISMIIANVQNLPDGWYKKVGALRKNAAKLGIFPSDMEIYNNANIRSSVYNVFGLETYVSDYGNGQWALNYYIDNRDACVALLTQNWGELAEIGISGTIGSGPEKPGGSFGPQATIAEAGEVCEKVGKAGNFEKGKALFEIWFH